MTIKDFIIDYRNNHSLSQRQFATLCGLSNGYISMLEKGANPKTGEAITPSLTVLKKIAYGIGMDLDTFFSMIDETGVSLSDDDIDNMAEEMSATNEDSGRAKEMLELFMQLQPELQDVIISQTKGLLNKL